MFIVLCLLPILTHCLLSGNLKDLLEPRKTQYMLLSASVAKGYNRIPAKLSSDNINILKQQKQMSDPALDQRQYDIANVDFTFRKQFEYTKTLQLQLTNQSLSKNEIMNQIAQRFNDDTYGNTIFYYTGSSEEHNGGWIICPQQQEYSQDCLIYYQDIVQTWKNRTNKLSSRHLLLILETSYVGIWANHLYLQVDFEDLSIVGATKAEQKAHDTGYGGFFTYNLMQSVRIFKKPQHVRDQNIESAQSVVSIGVGALLDRIFGLRVFYSSWSQIFTQASYVDLDL